MAVPSYEKACADWRRVAATADRAWETYRKARERLSRKRGTYAAEQGFIDASAAAARAQAALAAKETALRYACHYRADQDLALEARARLARTLADKTTRVETLFNAAIGRTA